MEKRLSAGMLIMCILFNINSLFANEKISGLRAGTLSIDSLVKSIAEDSLVRSRDIGSVTPLFKSVVENFPAVLSILRTNSKGLIVNEIVKVGEAGPRYRDVSDEIWYRSSKESRTLFAGNASSSREQSGYYIAHPILITRENGDIRFGGVFALLIDSAEISSVSPPHNPKKDGASALQESAKPQVAQVKPKSSEKGYSGTGPSEINQPDSHSPSPVPVSTARKNGVIPFLLFLETVLVGVLLLLLFRKRRARPSIAGEPPLQ